MKRIVMLVALLMSVVLITQAAGSLNLQELSYKELETLRDSVIQEMEKRNASPSPPTQSTSKPKFGDAVIQAIEKRNTSSSPPAPSTSKPSKTPVHTQRPTPSPYRKLEVGSKGEDVLAARMRLYELGYFKNVPTQTDFTAAMKDYVIEFQKANAITADGILTSDVQELLFSEKAEPKPKPIAKLQKPGNVKVSVSGIKVTISWSSVKDADSYNVYRSISSTGTYIKIANVKETKYTDNAPVRGKTFYYKVEAIAEKNQSDQTGSVKAAIPTPAPTPAPEPKYPLESTGYGNSGTSYGYKWFRNNYINTSAKYSVDGFTIAYYATNVYGEKIKAHGFGDYIQYEIVNKTIAPGKTGQAPKITAYGFNDAKRIYSAISKIHLTNGTTIDVPEKDRHYWYYEY